MYDSQQVPHRHSVDDSLGLVHSSFQSTVVHLSYTEKLRWVNVTDITPSTLEQQHKVYTLKKSPYYTLSLSKPGVVREKSNSSHFSLEEGGGSGGNCRTWGWGWGKGRGLWALHVRSSKTNHDQDDITSLDQHTATETPATVSTEQMRWGILSSNKKTVIRSNKKRHAGGPAKIFICAGVPDNKI